MEWRWFDFAWKTTYIQAQFVIGNLKMVVGSNCITTYNYVSAEFLVLNYITIIIIISVLTKGRPFTANAGAKVAVLLGINRCGSFLLFPHTALSLASEQTLKELKIPEAPS